jgi:broad specificity phosphatase PhoE
MPQTVWIARHANRLDFVHPEWFNTAKRRYDPPLSEDGLIQAQQLAQRLKTESIHHIFASPFLRTIQTAHAVAEVLDLPVKLEAGLGEWHNREWMSETPEIHPLEELLPDYPRIDPSYTSRLIPQYPESRETVNERTAKIAQLLVAEFTENLLLVGHGISVLGTTTGLIGGTPTVNAALCSLVQVVNQENRWEMLLNGDTSHLSQSESVIRFN